MFDDPFYDFCSPKTSHPTTYPAEPYQKMVLQHAFTPIPKMRDRMYSLGANAHFFFWFTYELRCALLGYVYASSLVINNSAAVLQSLTLSLIQEPRLSWNAYMGESEPMKNVKRIALKYDGRNLNDYCK